MLNLSYWFPSLNKEQCNVAIFLFHLFVDEQTQQVYYLENYKDHGTNKFFYTRADITKVQSLTIVEHILVLLQNQRWLSQNPQR